MCHPEIPRNVFWLIIIVFLSLVYFTYMYYQNDHKNWKWHTHFWHAKIEVIKLSIAKFFQVSNFFHKPISFTEQLIKQK
jgi:hypothetical protein